jgi:hypothetical protein
MPQDTILRALVDTRDRQIQKARLQFGNRLDAITRGDDQSSPEQTVIVQRWYKRFMDLEEELDKDIAAEVKQYDIYDYVTAVKGIGPMLAAKLVAMIDIHRGTHVSSLWKYAGLAVVDGKSERPTKGQKLGYNKRVRTTCFLIGESFLRSGSPYRAEYDKAREYYAANRPDWTDLHQHNAAMRKMVKLFLQHFWVTWRQLEGLSISKPYVNEKLGHEHYYGPESYGWPSVNGKAPG